MQNKQHWTTPEYGFFGKFYQKGDDSKSGYLSTLPQTQEERTKEEIDGVIRLLRLKPWFLVCDLPCGIGRHSIELSKRGFDSVLAVDSNLEQLVVGMQSTYNHRLFNSPTFRLGNMLEFTSRHMFHAIINMFSSFGFFETDEANKKVLQNFSDLLRPGGKFLMHTDVNLARVRSGKYKFEEKRLLQDGQSLQISERYDSNTKRIEGTWVIGGERKEYSVRVYENEEFVDLCEEVGLCDVNIYSDWSGSPYNEESEMVIFVAERQYRYSL